MKTKKNRLLSLACLLLMFSGVVLALTLQDGGKAYIVGSGKVWILGTDAAGSTPGGWMNAVMTSNFAPSPHTVKDLAAGNSDQWKWFDHDEGVVGTYSATPVVGKGVVYNFGTASAASITTLKVKNVSGQGLENWTFSASHDNSNWDQLATGTFADNETLQEDTFSSGDKYQYFRLVFDSVYSAGTSIQLYEVELWGT